MLLFLGHSCNFYTNNAQKALKKMIKKIKNFKIAFVMFNVLDKKYEYLLENLEINIESNLWSGFLLKNNVKNDVLLFLLSGEKKKNNQNLSHLIDHCQKEKYDLIFISADCPLKITGKLKKKLGKSVRDLSSIEKILKLHPDFYKQFYPNFKYKIFGIKKVTLKTASFFLCGCSYLNKIKNNPFYKSLNWKDKEKWRGCSYCASALSYKGIPYSRKVKILERQIKYLQKELPSLRIIEIPPPFSREFILAFSVLLKKFDLKALSFYVFFRPDDLVNTKKELEDLLKLMRKKSCSLLVENIGFENFSKKEITVLNRGYSPEMNEKAMEIFIYLKNRYPSTWITENTSASFILFEPFTSIEDLKINIARIIQLKKYFLSFYRLSFNKLVLKKDTPIYYLSKRAGLISRKPSPLDYCFKDQRIEKIYNTYKKFLNSIPENNQSRQALFFLMESLKINRVLTK